MSLSPQKVDFEKVWGTLSLGVGKILTLTGVSGMPMVEYPFLNNYNMISMLVFNSVSVVLFILWLLSLAFSRYFYFSN